MKGEWKLIGRLRRKVDKCPQMDFEKPALVVGLKKLSNHLKSRHQLNEIEEISNLKKNVTFWKLKNRQFFYESRILDEKYQNASSQNKNLLKELENLRNTLLKHCPEKNKEEAPKGNDWEMQSTQNGFLDEGREKKEAFKPKSILMRGSSFAEKPVKKHKIVGLSKKVSFASDFDLSQHEMKKKKKISKMTSCFMENPETTEQGQEMMAKMETISIKENEHVEESKKESEYEIDLNKEFGNMKNSYRFVDNEKYQSSSENLSDLGRSCPPEEHKAKTHQFREFRDKMLFIQDENTESDK